MLYRAAKHRDRVLRRKIFLSLKRLVKPLLQMMPSRGTQLLAEALRAIKQNRMKHKVGNYLRNKADTHYNKHLLKVVVSSWRTYTCLNTKKRSILEMAMNTIQCNRNERLIEVVFKSL